MKSVLIIGLGRFGRHMARKLIEEGNDVLAVEKDEDRAEHAMDIVRNIQIGDAADEQFLEAIGVNNFDLCVVAIGDNFQSALLITVLLKDLNARFIIARASRDVYRKLLLRNGANHVVYAEREVAERLAVKYGAKNIFDYIELTPELAIYEIAVPPSWYGKSIMEKAVRTKYHVSILATKQNGEINSLPHADHIFSKNETLMVLGSAKNIKSLTK